MYSVSHFTTDIKYVRVLSGYEYECSSFWGGGGKSKTAFKIHTRKKRITFLQNPATSAEK